jgi:CheY-like chemotaxis protein
MNKTDSRATIMVVEDFADSREMLAQWLMVRDFRVVHAVDGWEAVKVALQERPHLILMDLHLPVLDGTEVTCLLSEQDGLRDIPVVAVTAHDTADSRADASDAGCVEYVTKPVDFDRLDGIISRLLHGGQLR